jgi:hypothetical protein
VFPLVRRDPVLMWLPVLTGGRYFPRCLLLSDVAVVKVDGGGAEPSGSSVFAA